LQDKKYIWGCTCTGNLDGVVLSRGQRKESNGVLAVLLPSIVRQTPNQFGSYSKRLMLEKNDFILALLTFVTLSLLFFHYR
jgi:hypothetical protein